MIQVNAVVRVDMSSGNVAERIEEGIKKGLGKAGGAIRKTAERSIRSRKRPSPPGTPPSTRTKRLRKSILYEVQGNSVFIGPAESLIGPVGAAHEFGGQFRGDDYPARPFMRPALVKMTPRLASFWKNSITP